MSDYDFTIVDVFADGPFAGNQLAVFTSALGLGDDQMQSAASEMHYSETTFLLPPESPDMDLRIRIFTPYTELPFAGHPLVGSGFVAAAKRVVPCDPGVLRFGTGVGVIEVRPEVNGNREGGAVMRQPMPRIVAEYTDASDVAAIASDIGIDPQRIAAGRSPVAVLDNGLPMMVIPLDGIAAVAELDPAPADLRRLGDRLGAKTILLFSTETALAHSHAHCRVFAPGAGVHEDPATGSANGPFGFYLDRYRLVSADEIRVEQGFEMGRPSALKVTLGRDATGAVESVHVGGGVFVTAEGRMFF